MRRLFALTVALVAPRVVLSQTTDQAAVKAAVHAFHAALVRGDSSAVLQLLAPDVRVLESGATETLADYRSHHLPADIAYAQAVPSERAEASIVVQGDVAWVVATSKSSGSYRERPVNSAGAELMVLSRTSAGWRIRAIHWSSRNIRTP